MTFVVTPAFLDHFGLESAKDLPGLKELRASGLLEPLPPGSEPEEELQGEETEDMFQAPSEPEDPAKPV